MVRASSALILLAAILSGCVPETNIHQVGYFKSSAKDRVFTARMSETATLADVKAYAENAAYTQGRMTAVYIYDHDARVPADGVTQASGVLQVNDVLDLPGLSAWHFVFMRYRNGQSAFVDCSTKQSHELCRHNS